MGRQNHSPIDTHNDRLGTAFIQAVKMIAVNLTKSPLKGFNRRQQHILPVDVFPSNIVAVRVGKMANILALCPPVAFAEWMHRI